MKFDSRSADAVGKFGFAVNKADIPNVAPLMPWRERAAVSRAAAILGFAAGLIVAALGAGAEEPPRAQPTAKLTATDNVRSQPNAQRLAPPNQPDVSPNGARTVDAPYRLLIGPPPATSSDSRRRAAPNDDAAGSVRHWGPR